MGTLQKVHEHLFTLFKSNSELGRICHGIYYRVPNKAIMPYIFINKVKVKDWSSKTFNGYNVIFNISVFSNEDTRELMEIGDLIKTILNNYSFKNEELNIVTCKVLSSEIMHKNPNVNFQINMEFKMLIEELI